MITTRSEKVLQTKHIPTIECNYCHKTIDYKNHVPIGWAVITVTKEYNNFYETHICDECIKRKDL